MTECVLHRLRAAALVQQALAASHHPLLHAQMPKRHSPVHRPVRLQVGLLLLCMSALYTRQDALVTNPCLLACSCILDLQRAHQPCDGKGWPLPLTFFASVESLTAINDIKGNMLHHQYCCLCRSSVIQVFGLCQLPLKSFRSILRASCFALADSASSSKEGHLDTAMC